MGGFKQPSLNTIVPRSSLFFGEDLSASVKGETIDGRLSDEAIGFNIPFVGNEVGRSAEQSLSSNFPERLCFQIQGFMLHRVILSGMCPPSNPAGPSVEGGALLNARCTFMQKSGASPPGGGGLAVSVPGTVQLPSDGAAPRSRNSLQTPIITIMMMTTRLSR